VRATYTGHQRRVYPSYRDTGTGTTLVADPGGVYDIEPAASRWPLPPVPADHRFIPGNPPPKPDKPGKPAAGKAADGPAEANPEKPGKTGAGKAADGPGEVNSDGR